jgi:iron complex transport system permease protein
VGVLVSAALCLVAILAAPFVGHTTIDFHRALFAGQDSTDRAIFLTARLPRALLGAVCGGGLAAAGTALQATLRNPLASPFTLGVSGGGALGAAVAIALAAPFKIIGLAALAGCLCATWLVHRLARVGRSLPAATLLLAGVTFSFLASSGVSLLEYFAGPNRSFAIQSWLQGDLGVAALGHVIQPALTTAIAVGALWVYSRDLNAVSLGEEAAASVGVDVRRLTLIVYLASALAVAATVATAGPIAFVGLLAPHAARAVVGPDHRVLLPAATFGGAAALVACDTLGRTVLPSGEIPVGIVVCVLGAPFFLYLLLRMKARAVVWG